MSRFATLAVLFTLITIAAPAAASVSDEASRRLHTLMVEYDQLLFQRRPEFATRSGDHRTDDRLGIVTQATLERDVRLLRAQLARLETVPRDVLPADDRPAYDRLGGKLRGELKELVDDRRFQRDPGVYLDRTIVAVRDVLEADVSGSCERSRRAMRRLNQIPEALRAASINLSEPQRAATAAALDSIAVHVAWCRETAPARAGQCKDPQAFGAFVQADSSAIAALETFATFLRDAQRASESAAPGERQP